MQVTADVRPEGIAETFRTPAKPRLAAGMTSGVVSDSAA
jgi:hypothetical protein